MGRAPLQPGDGPIDGRHYLRSEPATVSWGWLPNRASRPVLTVDPGDVVTIDTVSHEGLMDDQGRDPLAFFARHGVAAGDVLRDAVAVAAEVPRQHGVAGPHVVTGPVEVRGARPGDLLAVDVLRVRRRVDYGVITNRHGLGALAGEYPEGPPPDPAASAARWEGFRTVSVFAPVEDTAEGPRAVLPYGSGDGGARRAARFPLRPFLGVTGVAVDTDEPVHSTPPGSHGGNLDIARLGAGSTLYLPVQVPGALAYAGDPHFAQGHGEVCLTALEGSLRADVRLRLLDGGDARRAAGLLQRPFAETDEHWIAIGLHVDLAEALRDATRGAIAFLEARFGMERQLAYLYLSAAADFEVSQVVDRVLGVHCTIRKRDLE
jgi:acetamidase/formamidase